MKKKTKILTICIFLLFILSLLLSVILYEKWGKGQAYRIVCLGDSILGNVRDDTSVTSVMESELGFPVFNGCFGGTCASFSEMRGRETDYEDSMSLVAISEAILHKDYAVQSFDLGGNRFSLPYFVEAWKPFKNVAFEEAEIVFIEHGVNDYSAGRPIKNETDPYDPATYTGALRIGIENVKKACPNATIVLVTPTFCRFFAFDGSPAGDCTNRDFGYGYLEDYVKAQIEVAEQYGLPYIDDYHTLGIDAGNVDALTVDGIHLNEEGRSLLASRLAEFVKTNLN